MDQCRLELRSLRNRTRTCPLRSMLADLADQLRHSIPVALAASAMELLDIIYGLNLDK